MKRYEMGRASLELEADSRPPALEETLKKIPTEHMDEVDRQQQDDIDGTRNLAIGALFACVTISLAQLGGFIFAIYEMGQAVDALRVVLGK